MKEWMARKGMDTSLLIQLVLWGAVLLIAFFLIRHYIVGAGTGPLPGEDLLKP